MSNRALLFWMMVASLAPIIWGSTYIVTTQLLIENKPLVASMLRALPAGSLLLLFSRQLPTGIWWFRAIVLGILNIGGFFYCLFYAAYLLPGGVAALVMSCQPIIVMLIGTLVLNNKLLPRQFIACVVAAIGVALLVIKPHSSLSLPGIIAGLSGAALMATGIVFTKKWGKPQDVSLPTFTGWQLLVGGLFLLPFALFQEGMPTHFTIKNIIGYSYLSLVGALLAYVLWFKAIEKLPVVTVSFISFASPIAATLLGYLILDEKLNALQLLGAGVIIFAIIISQLQLLKRSTPVQPDALSSVKN